MIQEDDLWGYPQDWNEYIDSRFEGSYQEWKRTKELSLEFTSAHTDAGGSVNTTPTRITLTWYSPTHITDIIQKLRSLGLI